LILQCQAFADISLDVCTPPQVEAIAASLVSLLEQPSDYQTCFALARLYHVLAKNETRKLDLWREGYILMLGSAKSEEELIRRKKAVECEIEYCGYNARDTLGIDFDYPVFHGKSLNQRFTYFRWYQAPISLGPMGQTLSFLCETLCHEQKLSHLKGESFKGRARLEREKAMKLYLFQMNAIDRFTESYGIEVPRLSKEAELTLLDSIFGQTTFGTEVAERVTLFLDDFYSVAVQMRLDRLYAVSQMVREELKPPVFNCAPKAIREAYFTFRNHFVPEGESPNVDARWRRHCREDAAQDALMVLAMHQWKPEVRCEAIGLMFCFRVPYCFSLSTELSRKLGNHETSNCCETSKQDFSQAITWSAFRL
jgi:hypothetical protein